MRKILQIAALAMVLLLLLAASASAQTNTPLPPPGLRLERAAATEAGGGTVTLLERVREHASLDKTSEHLAPGLRLAHYSAGLDIDLPTPARSPWKLVANLGVITTRLSSSEVTGMQSVPAGLSETYFSLGGGLTVEYTVAEHCRLFVAGREYLDLGTDDDLGVYRAVDATIYPIQDAAWTLPLTFGLRLTTR